RVLCMSASSPPDLPSFPTRRSSDLPRVRARRQGRARPGGGGAGGLGARGGGGRRRLGRGAAGPAARGHPADRGGAGPPGRGAHRSEEHTSELQSRENLVCRLLLEKK